MTTAETLHIWHQCVRDSDMSALDDILHDDVVFYSPVIFSPQEGRFLTKMYLKGATKVLASDDFTYVREMVDAENIVLEFEAKVDGLIINGVDMMKLDETGKITEFKVMVRPFKAIHLLKEKMVEALAQLQA